MREKNGVERTKTQKILTMNAIVGLCHFCEAHGPRHLFCTFTTHDERHTTEPTRSSVHCNGCASLGPETVFVSRDNDGTLYCSRENMPNPDVTAFLRQAAIRSITVEVTGGDVVYFSDNRGHVLALMFQLHDTRARGLKRWFSIVVLMKDKMLLLNITPLLSEHMKKIAKELQELSEAVYNEEQKICSQRALRLKTGRNDFGQSRSLIQLTGDANIFKRLHTHFTWMLKAGGLTYSETLYTSQNLLQKLHPKATNGSIFEESACSPPDGNECMPLRALENLVSKTNFKTLLYCALTGINIIIRCQHTNPELIVKGLGRLLPNAVNNHIRSCGKLEQVTPTASSCFLEETMDSKFICKWHGILPSKCPLLMNRIENAMSNPTFNNDVLHQHVTSLLLEWLGISRAMKSAIESSGTKSDAVVKLKQVFGISPQDDPLISYWISTYCKISKTYKMS